jgi:hypothetical protein
MNEELPSEIMLTEKRKLVSKVKASLETLLHSMTQVKAHETGTSASKSTTGNAVNDPKESFAACLMLMAGVPCSCTGNEGCC